MSILQRLAGGTATILTSAVLLTGCTDSASSAPEAVVTANPATADDAVAAGLISPEVLTETKLGVPTTLDPKAKPIDTSCVSIDGEALLVSDISPQFGEIAFRVLSGSAVFETSTDAAEALAALGESHAVDCLPGEIGSSSPEGLIEEDTEMLDDPEIGDESLAMDSELSDYEHGIGNDNNHAFTMLAFRVGPSVTIVLVWESSQMLADTEDRLGLAHSIAEVLAAQVAEAL